MTVVHPSTDKGISNQPDDSVEFRVLLSASTMNEDSPPPTSKWKWTSCRWASLLPPLLSKPGQVQGKQHAWFWSSRPYQKAGQNTRSAREQQEQDRERERETKYLHCSSSSLLWSEALNWGSFPITCVRIKKSRAKPVLASAPVLHVRYRVETYLSCEHTLQKYTLWQRDTVFKSNWR